MGQPRLGNIRYQDNPPFVLTLTRIFLLHHPVDKSAGRLAGKPISQCAGSRVRDCGESWLSADPAT